ncbi:MAG: histidine kinase [Bacteroidota bacterium]
MRNEYKISIGISLALALVIAFRWVTISDQIPELKLYIPESDTNQQFLFIVVSVFLTSLLFFQYNFFWKKLTYRLSNKLFRYSIDFAINFVLIIVTSLFWTSLSSAFIDAGPKKGLLPFASMRNSIIAIITVSIAYSYDTFQKSKQDRYKLLTVTKEKVEAELAALKAQIDPHFLFNSLNSLTGVIRQDQKEAIHFVNHLSETLRYTLENKNQNLISLEEELNYLKSYEYMMHKRFGDAFKINFQIASDKLKRKVPQFALQLPIENAFKHNIVSLKKPLIIDIKTGEDHLIVSNNVQLKQSESGHGIGLSNLSKRYELLNAKPVEVEQNEENFIVKISLI